MINQMDAVFETLGTEVRRCLLSEFDHRRIKLVEPRTQTPDHIRGTFVVREVEKALIATALAEKLIRQMVHDVVSELPESTKNVAFAALPGEIVISDDLSLHRVDDGGISFTIEAMYDPRVAATRFIFDFLLMTD